MVRKKLAKAKDTAGRRIKKLRGKESDPVEKAVVPFITNDTIAEHREEVLSGARKFILPLQHSRRRVIWLSAIIFGITVISFLSYSLLGLYKFQNTSTFMYRITQVVPFPVARAKGSFISYESYLFELRHYMHYYETQQKLNFDSEEGKAQLVDFKRQAMEQVINDAYVKHIAAENGISVSTAEVDQEIALVRQQSRLGTSDQVFEDVLRDFWGWSVGDFRRSLRQQILARKVASKMDTEAHDRANAALAELRGGADFADVAKKYSDDEATIEDGGNYGAAIDKSTRDLSAKVTDVIFGQEAGEVSGIVDTGYSLEIIKTVSFEDSKARAAHIQINIRDIKEHVDSLRETSPPTNYLKF